MVLITEFGSKEERLTFEPSSNNTFVFSSPDKCGSFSPTFINLYTYFGLSQYCISLLSL